MSRMPTMTPEGRKKRHQAWQAGQDWANGAYEQENLIEAQDNRDEQVEYLRGIGQWFSSKAHELAKEEE